MIDREAPQPRHEIRICRALQCRMNGSEDVIRAAEARLGLGRDQTSPDNEVRLQVIHCFGHCTEGPNVRVDGQMSHHVTPAEIRRLIDEALGG